MVKPSSIPEPEQRSTQSESPVFVALSQAQLVGLDGAYVLTGNARLAKEVRVASDAAFLATGRTAWRTPTASTVSAFCRSLADSHLQPPSTIDNPALTALCRLAAPDLAPAVLCDAFNLCQGSMIDPSSAASGAMAATASGRTFQRVYRSLMSTLANDKMLAESQLPAWIADQLTNNDAWRPTLPANVWLLGFEQIDASTSALLEALASRGVRSEKLPITLPSNSTPLRVACSTPEQELSAAAQFARQTLASDPDATVGIVVPDLEQRYQSTIRQFDAEFTPFGVDRRSRRLFNTSGGEPLAEVAVVNAAMNLLKFTLYPLPPVQVTALIASPFLNLTHLRMVPELPSLMRFEDLSPLSSLDPLASRPAHPDRQSLADWISYFQTVLASAGWGAAGSRQFQAYNAAFAVFEQLKAPSEHSITGMEAYTVVRDAMMARRFAPETPPAPVQILGYLETTGLRFSHLWITGMRDTEWPTNSSPNPYIPRTMLLAAAVPRVERTQELEFCRHLVAYWRSAANEVVFSHAVQSAEVDAQANHNPSTLIGGIPEVEIEQVIPGFRDGSHPHLAASAAIATVMERRVDAHGRVVDSAHLSGGTGRLRDQAHCPFRGWAMHQLGLREARTPHGYPDAMDRGILLHELLHELVTANGVAVEAVAKSVIGRLYRRFPKSFRTREQARVVQLLRAWQNFDRDRQPFEIVASESESEFSLADLSLTLRIDRVEARDVGRTVVDYKTGDISIAGLFDERLSEPQLPLYALAIDGVQAVVFAQIKDGHIRVSGVRSSTIDDLKSIRISQDWQRTRTVWQTALETLANEITSGFAGVRPYRADTCRRCHLHPLCRIHDNADSEHA